MRIALVSLAAIALSYVLGLVLGTFIPVTAHDPDCLPQQVKKTEPKGYYTTEELNRAEADAKKRIECLREKTKEKSAHQFMLEAREAGKWFTWLPWLAVPFLARLRSYGTAFAPITALIALAALGIFQTVEAGLSIAALAVGFMFMQRKDTNAQSNA